MQRGRVRSLETSCGRNIFLSVEFLGVGGIQCNADGDANDSMEALDDSRGLPAQPGETLLEVKMSETQPLFHEEPYLKQLECRVDLLERDDAGLPFALLRETVFYPQGGGQLGDRGVLNIPGPRKSEALRALEIVSTKKRDDQIRHYLSVDDEVFTLLRECAIGQQATATLDWPLRYHQMRLHSAMHFMHCMLEQTLGRSIPHPIRSPLSDEGGENQYEFIGEFDEDSLRRATDALNEFCSASHEIRTEADTSKGHGFRWWQCEDWSIPCGGVHVRNTQEIGVVTSSMKIKKNTTRVIVTLSAEAEELG